MVEKTRKRSTRLSKLATCIRHGAATARVGKTGMFNSSTFNPSVLTPAMSGKFTALIAKIRELDSSDATAHGKYFKHFIFTDLRNSAYGVKALAGFMISAGFDLRMSNVSKKIKRDGKWINTKHGEVKHIIKDPVSTGSNGFAILQSQPLWKNPLSVSAKKDILRAYNSRPDNINGELLRIVILDSKYKEGIDLYDVKYVHLLEPPIATSDLKQAVGRATRFCGQRGLHFVPRQGWPLDVFVYRTQLPGRAPFSSGSGSSSNAVQKIDAHELMLAKSGLDLALINLTKELTILAISSAVDYDLNYKINNFKMESALLTESDDFLVAEVQRGGTRVRNVYSANELNSKQIAKCFRRASKLYPFTKREMIEVARSMGLPIRQSMKREDYCRLLQSNPDYFATLMNPASIDSLHVVPPSSSLTSPVASLFPSPRSIAPSSASLGGVATLFKTPKEVASTLKDLESRPFSEFQTGIVDLYGRFGWESPIVRDGCGVVAAGASGQPVTFTRTQDFVRHYLTPTSPFKGLLAWHSVGTGKTCMAVAAATSEFEAAGYTILWVTRNALMADVYKNIFGAVCSIPIADAVRKGAEIPSDLANAKRMLSRAWLAPISYRMFQNALEKKNDLGRALYAKSSGGDPLHKTFLVMDEIHKLRDGDLSSAEFADFNVIQKYIHESYEKSGDDSVRPLLMTATPITDSPTELFDILNTLIADKSRQLMEFNTYRDKYTTDEGHISDAGRDYFQDRAKGLVSYLNREYDPTTFAQPVFHNVDVPVGSIVLPDADEMAAKCLSGVDLTLPSPLPARRKTTAKKGKATNAAAKTRRKQILQDVSKCYTDQKKALTSQASKSQMIALESCFSKKKHDGLPSRAAVLEVVKAKLGAKNSIKSPTSSIDSAAAVLDS